MSNSIFTKRLQTILVVGCILLGLVILFSVVILPPKIFANTSSSRTENTAYNLKNAISAYNTEYREWPIQSKSDVTVESDSQLMSLLMAADSETEAGQIGPRQITFFSGKKARPMSNNRFREGVHLETLTLWDSWGNPYRAAFDNNVDNTINSPEAPGTPIPTTVLIWSAGPDGDFDTWEDNIKTW